MRVLGRGIGWVASSAAARNDADVAHGQALAPLDAGLLDTDGDGIRARRRVGVFACPPDGLARGNAVPGGPAPEAGGGQDDDCDAAIVEAVWGSFDSNGNRREDRRWTTVMACACERLREGRGRVAPPCGATEEWLDGCNGAVHVGFAFDLEARRRQACH